MGSNELFGCPAQGDLIHPIGGKFSHARDDGTYQPAGAGALDASSSKLGRCLAPSSPTAGATVGV